MKVIYLAAGAGGMICGSCLRDNRLAATLIERVYSAEECRGLGVSLADLVRRDITDKIKPDR